jgi:aryl-alcohol dehydrogenase-like predicted oxidoreductase
MNINDRIGLGTVQFGLNYGINNTSGKVNEDIARKIVKTYYKTVNAPVFDTAQAYGDSEEVLGDSLKALNINGDLLIISKFSNKVTNAHELNVSFQNTIARLQVKNLYALLAHDANSLINKNELYNELIQLKKKGCVQKIGVSAYFPHQVQWFLKNKMPLDIIQVPYNIFDRRFEFFFTEFKRNEIEIHTRSAFLQGLFFKDVNSLPTHFEAVKNKIFNIQNISKAAGLSLNKLLLIFCLQQRLIDKVIIGVDSEKHLQDNLITEHDLLKYNNVSEQIVSYEPIDDNIILPFNWPNT